YILPIPSKTEEREISFSRDVQPLFDIDCAGCHNNVAMYPNLAAGNSYNALTTTLPNCGGSYIDTINPSLSLIYTILLPSPACVSGQMPPSNPWPPTKIQMVLDWINQGALNN
ncbi:MAG: hypothetical protein A3K10_12900, partial [Bacteroidetes bacterium RIFCSPLOWO2_12_FULL_31_6]